MINLDPVIIDDLSVFALRKEVRIAAARTCDIGSRQRVEVQYRSRYRVNPVIRDLVVGKVQARERVFDSAATGEGREITIARPCGRHGRCKRERDVVALSQIIVKEEGAILEDRAADCAAELMNLLNGFIRDEAVAATDSQSAITFEYRVKSIERRVLAVVVERPVKLDWCPI